MEKYQIYKQSIAVDNKSWWGNMELLKCTEFAWVIKGKIYENIKKKEYVNYSKV